MPMQQPVPNVLIAGTSARAAAFSAFRGELSVAAADQFADCDLATVATATAIEEWPRGVLDWGASFPQHIPLIYIGGLENEPQLLEDLQRQRPVLGVVGETLARVRTPELLQKMLAPAGFRWAEALERNPAMTSGARFLVKRRKSGGGRGIRFWNGASLLPGEYLQQYHEGDSCSAAYLAREGECELLGTARSLAPNEESHDPFRYQGSVTLDLGFQEGEQLAAVGNQLAKSGMQGLFGIDFIRSHLIEGELIFLEVNPRFTASMEIHELRLGRSFVADHLAAFGCGNTSSGRRRMGKAMHVGKRIVYAPRPLRSAEIALPSPLEVRGGEYSIADIPAAGAIHQAGAPICTVLAAAERSEACDPILADLEATVLAQCEAV